MKTFLITILALLYLASVTGVNIHLHYCMGELASGHLTEKPLPNKCSKCGMTSEKSKKGCCEDKHKFVKVEKDQKTVETVFNLSKAPVAVLANTHYRYTFIYRYSITRSLPYSHAPPDKPNIPAYIFNCVFRI